MPTVAPFVESAVRRAGLSRAGSCRLTLDPSGARVAYQVNCPPEKPPQGGQRFLPNGVPASAIGQRVFVAVVDGGVTTAVGPDGANSWRPSWSPDGQRLAFYCDEHGNPHLWIYEVSTGQARRVSEASIKAHLVVGDEPQWRPDGAEVIVPIVPAHGPHRTPKPNVATDQATGVQVYEVDAEGAQGDQSAGLDLNAHYMRENNAAVGAVSVGDGALRIVVSADSEPKPSVAQVSPTGRWVSYLSVAREDREKEAAVGYGVHDLALVPSVGGEVSLVADRIAVPLGNVYLATYIWHPTRDQLFWVRDRQLWTAVAEESTWAPRQLAVELGEFTVAPLQVTRDGTAVIAGVNPLDLNDYADPRPQRLAVVPLNGGPESTIPLPEGLLFLDLVGQSPATTWEPQPGVVTAIAQRRGAAEVALLRIDVATGRVSTAWQKAAQINAAGAPSDHRFLVAGFEDFDHPANLYVFDESCTRSRQITQLESGLEDPRFGPVDTVETSVPSSDGSRTNATTTVLLPAGTARGDRLPALVLVYPGGNMSGYASEFGGGSPSGFPVWPLLASGYAVLLAEVPRGAADVGDRGPVQELVDGLVPQLHHAAELGYIDPARVALAGHSYGAYASAAVISGTEMFRAAVAISGVYDLPGSYGWLDFGRQSPPFPEWYENGQGGMGTHPWADLQRYLDNSPYYRADRIHTPLLLLHGGSDQVCPAAEAGKMFSALKRLNRTALLAVYNGEGHGTETWSPSNVADATTRLLKFLDLHLSPSP